MKHINCMLLFKVNSQILIYKEFLLSNVPGSESDACNANVDLISTTAAPPTSTQSLVGPQGPKVI